MRKSMMVVAFAGAVIGTSTGGLLGSAAAPAVIVRDIPAPKNLQSEAPEGPVDAALVAKQIVSGPTGQRLIVEASARVKVDGVRVMRSVALYDSAGKALVPAVRSTQRALKTTDTDAELFEVPEGLPDGFYYVELLTAYSEKASGTPMIPMTRLHLKVANAQLQLLTAADWDIQVNALDSAVAIGGKDPVK